MRTLKASAVTAISSVGCSEGEMPHHHFCTSGTSLLHTLANCDLKVYCSSFHELDLVAHWGSDQEGGLQNATESFKRQVGLP